MLQVARYLLGSPGASGFGSKSTAEEVTAACPDLGSLTAIITGATSGIGAETARVLAKRGARVVMPARNVKAAEDMRARICGECPDADVLVLHLDLSSLASVRAFAQRFLALGLPLHLLINNAGKFSHGQLALSEDGVEMTFATNYLGHFLLTELLLGRMAETAAATGVQGRIVNVSSSVHSWFSGDWAEYLSLVTRRKIAYDATQAYAVSKLANVLHTNELAARLKVRSGDGRGRDGELRPPGHRQDPPQPRPGGPAHRSGVRAAVEAAQDNPPGCGNHVLCGGAPEAGRHFRLLLRRLQRGAAFASRGQPL
ncbi:unnamed protein product [Alopecurus aequalis]